MLLIRNTNLFEKLKNMNDHMCSNTVQKYLVELHLITNVERKKKSITFFHFSVPVIKVMPELKNKSKKTEKLMGVLRCTKEKLEAIENKAKSENITVTELFNRALDKYCDLD